MGRSHSVELSGKLWDVMALILEGASDRQIMAKLDLAQRAFSDRIYQIKKIGIPLKYSRLKGAHVTSFPSYGVRMELSPRDMFHLMYTLVRAKRAESRTVVSRLEKIGWAQSAYTLDVTQMDGAGRVEVSSGLRTKLELIQNACGSGQSLRLQEKLSSGELRQVESVDPYCLLLGPLQARLVAWHPESEGFVSYDVLRLDYIEINGGTFVRKDFQLHDYLGDSWGVQPSPRRGDPHEVSVLFTHEAALAMREFKMHPSQRVERHADGLLVHWRLTNLDELCSWLLSCLGSFKIVKGEALEKLISERINGYLVRHSH